MTAWGTKSLESSQGLRDTVRNVLHSKKYKISFKIVYDITAQCKIFYGTMPFFLREMCSECTEIITNILGLILTKSSEGNVHILPYDEFRRHCTCAAANSHPVLFHY